jgi:two-component system, OmpR family, sensor kinase
MGQPSGSASVWQAIRRLPDRTPLWVKLTAAVLVLVTAALTVISVAGATVLRGYLLHQYDQELAILDTSANQQALRGQVISYVQYGRPQQIGFSVQWLPSTRPVQQTSVQFSGYSSLGLPNFGPAPGPTVRHGASWLGQSLNQPVTVGSANGHRWRVISFDTVIPTLSGRAVPGTVIVGLNVTTVYQTVGELADTDLIISGGLLVILAILAIAMIRASMRQLVDIEHTAAAIAAGDLTRRVPERDPRTEVGRLGRAINVMLAHIETSFRARSASEEAARRSEDAARRSALAASRSEDRMRRFVADASHELRTPLTAIRGYAEYYRQRGGVEPASANGGAAPARARRAKPTDLASATQGKLSRSDLDHLIQRVEQESTRMGVLVDDMLLLARLDQERSLDFRTVDLLAIAADALHDARVIAPDRSITLTVSTPDAALVQGDEAGLRQVVGNLMSNAITHTPNGTQIDITIRVARLTGERAPAHPAEPAVVLEVADQGPGLSADQMEHVFERFYRTDRARSRSAGGTGLGLAIVSAMVTAHHGRVWVDSTPGRGARFGFALPLAPEARLAGA